MIKELEIKELVIKPQTIPTAGPRWFIGPGPVGI